MTLAHFTISCPSSQGEALEHIHLLTDALKTLGAVTFRSKYDPDENVAIVYGWRADVDPRAAA